MFVLVPYQHDRMSVKRLPWVSIALLAANLLVFLLTRGAALEAQERESEALQAVTAYWVGHPFVETTPAFRARFRLPVSGLRGLMNKTLEPPESADLERQQAEFETLQRAALGAAESSPYHAWGFRPAEPGLRSAVTSLFLHAGWMHLLGNMLFLYLSAPFVENLWGRLLFPLFYLSGGVAAAYAQALRFPGSAIPLIGASGAIAAVMGAFLVRLGGTRIRFFYAWMLVGVRWGTFPAPAWLMLPLWFLSQLVSADTAGGGGGVAYWAHVGGFLFGAVFALALRASGLEARFIAPGVALASSATGDPRVDRGLELREAGDLDGAAAQFEAALREKPDLADAHGGLFATAILRNDLERARRHARPMLEGYLRAGGTVMALERYGEALRLLPDLVLPPRVLFAIAGHEERALGPEAAIATYRRLAEQHPADPLTLKGLIQAAKVAGAAGLDADGGWALETARAHPLATGEWARRIAEAAPATSSSRTSRR